MRNCKGKAAATPSPTPVDPEATPRPRTLAGAVHALAADLRAPKSTLTRLASARRSVDNLRLASSRSKSCSFLPSTASDAPLLTLLLASTSFLDTTITNDGERLYVIETQGSKTNICREDAVQGLAHVGAISWRNEDAEHKPLSIRSSVTVQMAHGRERYVEEFLRRTKLSSSRLFNIPHYAHTLKWKRSGGLYKLLAAKTKMTVATLEPAMLAAPPRIKIFETMYEHDETRPQLEYRKVPVFLLDYIIATALLLVADKDEWLHAGSAESSAASASASPFRLGAQGTIQRWRLEIQTEPFTNFPSRPASPVPSSSGHPGLPKNEPHLIRSHSGRSVSFHMSNAFRQKSYGVRASLPAIDRSSSISRPSSSRTTTTISAHPFSMELPGSDEEVDIASQTDDFETDFSPLSNELQSISDARSGEERLLERHISTRARCASESILGPETPRQSIRSLPASPEWSASSSAHAPQRTSSTSTTESKRPFRPLPRTPTSDIPPVPSLPRPWRMSSDPSGSIMTSLSVSPSGDFASGPATPSPISAVATSSYAMEQPTAGPSSRPISTEASSSASKEAPRPTLRRIASEATLASAKPSSDEASRPSTSGDPSISKPLRQRSVHDNRPVPPKMSRPHTSSGQRRTIPTTSPLRLRNISERDTDLIASPSSTFSHSSRPTIYFPPSHPPPDEEEYPIAYASHVQPPPSYDSIDFSRPC
ncbi:hypothetical protein DFH11DRAFT_446511 [Phellopilus nigrolimitatus]|nr:hypothetical protein DFH11DRAFT_446511 [Phellopilus nigrolimitatus]